MCLQTADFQCFVILVIVIPAGLRIPSAVFSIKDIMTASSVSKEVSNYDEVSMQQSLLFSDSLKVLDASA